MLDSIVNSFFDSIVKPNTSVIDKDRYLLTIHYYEELVFFFFFLLQPNHIKKCLRKLERGHSVTDYNLYFPY